MQDNIERLCRIICESKGINPDGDGFGMGHIIPNGSRYKLWEAQRATAVAILEAGNE